MTPLVHTQNVSRETFSHLLKHFEQNRLQLQEYARQLKWWNQRINLVSRDMDDSLLQNHILHSLTPMLLDNWKNISVAIDAGSGGGLPGIPLAIVNPETNWLLNDINQKKTLALKQIVRSLHLNNIEIVHGDIGGIAIPRESAIVTKHAFAVNDLFHKLSDKPWDMLVFLKGEDFHSELEGIPDGFFINSHQLEQATYNPFFSAKVVLVLQRKLNEQPA